MSILRTIGVTSPLAAVFGYLIHENCETKQLGRSVRIHSRDGKALELHLSYPVGPLWRWKNYGREGDIRITWFDTTKLIDNVT